MKLVIILAVILGVLGVMACQPEKADTIIPPEKADTIIPSDVSYSVIATDDVPGIKRSLDVRLNKKVSKDVLREIAHELKSNDSREYERTFIGYYLPGMTVDAGYWATTHFNPTLDVRILGSSLTKEPALATEPVPSNRVVIGTWLDESIGSEIAMYRESGTLSMEQKFNDGSSLKEEVVEKSSPLGRRFDKKEGSSFGDHWIIDREGNLQIRDNVGLINTAIKIQ